MAPQLVLAVLALACLGVASQPDCNELMIRPLGDLSSYVGKWIFHAGTTDTEDSLAKLKTFSSFWIHPKHVPNGGHETMELSSKMDGKCNYVEANVTTTGSRTIMTFNFENRTYFHDGQNYETCPDCLLWYDTARSPGLADSRNLYIFTRTGNLTLPHLEEFKQQAACLNFTLGLHMSSDTDLCPEEKEEKAEKEDE